MVDTQGLIADHGTSSERNGNGKTIMTETPPIIADEAPSADSITAYDEAHFVTYLRLLDAEADGADWREAAQVILRLDPAVDPEHARGCWKSHLQRARWTAERGYRHLLEAANTP